MIINHQATSIVQQCTIYPSDLQRNFLATTHHIPNINLLSPALRLSTKLQNLLYPQTVVFLLTLWAPGAIGLFHHSSGWAKGDYLSSLCFSSHEEHILYLDTNDLMLKYQKHTHTEAFFTVHLHFNTYIFIYHTDITWKTKAVLIFQNSVTEISYKNISYIILTKREYIITSPLSFVISNIHITFPLRSHPLYSIDIRC